MYSTKNSGLNYGNFRVPNWKAFSAEPDRSRSIPAWEHFPPIFTRQNAEEKWWSGYSKCSKLLDTKKFDTHSRVNFSETFTWSTQELFSWDNKLANFSCGRLRKPCKCPQEIRDDQPTIFQKADPKVFQEERRSIKGSNSDRSFCFQCSIHSPPSWSC